MRPQPRRAESTMRVKLGLGVVAVAAIGVGAGLWLAFSISPGASFTNTELVPLGAAAEPPASLPAYVSLPVPFTTQAPLGNWVSSQHDCEEATLVMVDRYLRGDHSGRAIDPETADAAIKRMTPWKPAEDLTDEQLGEMANDHLGWAWQIFPATVLNIKQQLALGRPVIVGVRTHGLGNADYPGYYAHYEEPAWSVSHYLVVAGYDAKTVILNDPGITRGHGYHITFDQLSYAISDLDRAYPNLNQGLIFLVVAPVAS